MFRITLWYCSPASRKRYNHRTMFRITLWYYSPATRKRNNHRPIFLFVWPRAWRSVIPLQPGNDVIAVLQWYYCHPFPKRIVNGVYCNMFNFYRIDKLGIKQWERSPPLPCLNWNEALHYHVLMGLKPSASCIVNTCAG